MQNAFYTAKVPAAQLAAVNAEIAHLKTQVPAMEKMKLRSSANAEDIPNFDGAVFASLWNTRAIEERSFARLDHATASMGIAVVPKYDAESQVAANGLIITRSVNSDFLAYTLSVQRGNEPRSRHHLADDARHLQRRRPPYPLHRHALRHPRWRAASSW